MFPLVVVVPLPLVFPLTVLPLCDADALPRVLGTPLIPLVGTPLPLPLAATTQYISKWIIDYEGMIEMS